VVAELGDGSATTLLERVAEASERRPDDMAACLLRVEGNASRGCSRIEELELDDSAVARESASRFLAACGVGAAPTAEILGSASLTPGRAGSSILRVVRIGDEEPQAELYEQDVAALR
jgi:hypothetical protein